MKSHGSANNGGNSRSGGGQGSNDGANQKTHEDNERVLSNARNQTMKEKRMSAKETVLRDHQCKEKNIYKKNEKHLCIYL